MFKTMIAISSCCKMTFPPQTISKATALIPRMWYSARPRGETGKEEKRKKTTILTIREIYDRREPISMLTAHDYPSALMVQNAGIDLLLVGDSLAMVALGYPDTTSISVEEMLHHCRAVARGATLPFLIADMPFGSYHISADQAVENAIRFVKEGKMEAVKIEGGVEIAETAKRIVKAGIPVLGHIGLTPQTQVSLGGFRVQGKTAKQALKLHDDAQALQDAGCFGVVLEAIPDPIAKVITDSLSIPTIGIGAGPNTSGQVLVQQDMLGIFDKFVPKFCKVFGDAGSTILEANRKYHHEVKSREFPTPQHCYPMDEEELKKFYSAIHQKKN